MKSFNKFLNEKNGLWDNIHAKRKRGEKPNPPGHPDRPTAQDFKNAQKTSKEEYSSDAQRKAVWASRNDEKKSKKEAVEEKKLTPAELKKREEIAKAMERENPGMDMKKKMAIATWQAKKVAEEAKLEEGLYHVEYGRSGKLTHQVVAKDAKDAHQKAMAHLKKKNPKLAHPDYADTFHKPSITHIKGNEPRADKYKTEATEIDEISLSHLSNKIANSTGTKNVKTAMKPGEVKKGLDDLKKRLATLGQEPKMAKEAYEEEPASPDEKSMAMRQAKFIQYVGDEIMEHLEQDGDFPEWMQNKLSELHQKAKDMHSTMAGSYEDDEEEMDEAVQSADKKPEKFIKPDGKVGIRMVRVDKKIVSTDK